ncbi:type A von Willebrand factor domain-containing protein [Cavenderia fasciculata]|uniref:Midasin n=1 Tax=Cavenderia fasciculata TaxID=261658 RepID=F4PTV2_CACFS|nr:type A von Willebrand factor domain-containing protein [Cavenderia fasciculata]EGG20931.1 type A von Willebrand factor domain-containing protein [Cavenderia fasciculata]|eukprot:XP_004358781.1 type A von Willebrand factor domain-containing protein [Cavenderia fasciculata]
METSSSSSSSYSFKFNLFEALKVLKQHIDNNNDNKDNGDSYESIQSILQNKTESADQFTDHDRTYVLTQLSNIMMTKSSQTITITHIFRPIVIDLVSRYLATPAASQSVETSSFIFSQLLPITPQLEGIIVQYYQRVPSIFDRISLITDITKENHERWLQLAQTCYRLLSYNSKLFSNIWNWAPFFTLLEIDNARLRWYIIKSICILLSMPEKKSEHLVQFYQQYNHQIIELEQEIKSYESSLLFLNDNNQLHLINNNNNNTINVDSSSSSSNSKCLIEKKDLCNSIVDICGVLLFKKFNLTTTTTTSTISTTPLGSTGSGKTTLVNELARATGNHDIIKIHLGDQTDAKVLLGTYVTSDIPGEFKWQPGALTQAVSQGRWIVVEDIDLAPIEVLSVLIPLLESRTLFIPGRGEAIAAANGFQLFATQTLFGGGHSRAQNVNILSHLWTRVVIESLSNAELSHVLITRFPSLAPIVPKFIDTFSTLQRALTSHSGAHSELASASSRPISLRDVLKWVWRASKRLATTKLNHITSTINELIFVEALDCFCSLVAKRVLRDRLAEIIGKCWDIPEDRVNYYSNLYKPSIEIVPNVGMQIGRSQLVNQHHNNSTSQQQQSTSSNFAHTMASLRMIEKISIAIESNEPVLLVGETGTGKTTVVQYIADQLGQKLIVLNLNQQSDSADLIGGFKPVEMRLLCTPLKNRFETLFKRTFSESSNAEFLERINTSYANKNWKQFVTLLGKAVKLVENKFNNKDDENNNTTSGGKKKKQSDTSTTTSTSKKSIKPELREQWKQLANEATRLQTQLQKSQSAFAFSFVEGALVSALRQGHWVLLDEMNLASSETLESLSGLFDGGSLTLTEKGDVEPVPRHANFKVFACMNPPTDIGKRDLPPGIRNRFTEFYIDELEAKADLALVVRTLMTGIVAQPPVDDIVEFYLAIKKEAQNKLLDGSNQKPHFSLRTLSRALHYVRQATPHFGLARALYEGINMSFLTQLNRNSIPLVEQVIRQFIRKGEQSKFNQPLKQPTNKHIQIEQFWVETGDLQPQQPAHYILTPSIKANLNNLARILVSRKHPILLQGPTSSGKTSMVEYLAQRTGHRFIRINNHEHTDLQEYLGQYISDERGRLVFQEGILVEAVRKGYWVVLDELNLAPSEVLEALNRLLDDNRELYIPETQETVKPHPSFMLFATQNPPGLYGGRKILSRAFRNRFLELHIDDIPEHELEEILSKRCSLPPSYCKKLVAIMRELQTNRQGASQVFAGKHGYITFRDLFRWAERNPSSYDELGRAGYMLLAERLRKEEEKAVIRAVIEKHLKIKLDPEEMYGCGDNDTEFQQMLGIVAKEIDSGNGHGLEKIVWTRAMKRLFSLVGHCLKHREPILLVGETGCSKTTICQIYSLLNKQHLNILNCHQHTETADFLGGLRPVRGREQILSTIETLIHNYEQLVNLERDSLSSSNNIEESIKKLIDSWSIKKLELQPKQQEEVQVQPQPKKNNKKNKQQQKMDIDSSSSSNDGNHSKLIEEIEKIISMIEKNYQQYCSLFLWVDGPLVESMKQGSYFLIDEISLAEDAVLERLNSVLEPSRLLVLAEKGGVEIEELRGHQEFRIMATMNPGGDFGKKELSPAMRNRFTEIWVPAITARDDLEQIVRERFEEPVLTALPTSPSKMLDFLEYLAMVQKNKRVISLRDILSWVSFMNMCAKKQLLSPWDSYVHGACLVLLDGFGMGSNSSSEADGVRLRTLCIDRILSQIEDDAARQSLTSYFNAGGAGDSRPVAGLAANQSTSTSSTFIQADSFGIHPFYIHRRESTDTVTPFSLGAPTTSRNALRVLRGMQLPRAILIEGSPGVGKTSLITAIAQASGHRVVRINLSEQTDIMDLLGSDLPVEGGKGGQFEWRDGIFLKALREGDWVLLDELNLASQTVLEGLNACLDHRSEVFIPELGRTFTCHPGFRVFACQNPLHQGGGRKGLPKSFLNRFTQVFIDQLDHQDLLFISSAMYPLISQDTLTKMIQFNHLLYQHSMVESKFGRRGAPWEFNLRDIFRWCDLVVKDSKAYFEQDNNNQMELDTNKKNKKQVKVPTKVTPLVVKNNPSRFIDLIYLRRMRSEEDRKYIQALYRQVFGTMDEEIDFESDQHPNFSITSQYLQIGKTILPRRQDGSPKLDSSSSSDILLLQRMLNPMESLMKCVELNWMSILIGPSSSSKTSSIRLLAQLTGNQLFEFSMNSAVDTTELLGGFEQVDLVRHQKAAVDATHTLIRQMSCDILAISNDNGTLSQCSAALQDIHAAWGIFTTRAKFSSDAIVSQKVQAIDMEQFNILSQILTALDRVVDKFRVNFAAANDSDTRYTQAIGSIRNQITRLQTIEKESVTGCFEWIDGLLVRALETGAWIVIDNANFCNPTVLDRLNPLLEQGGVLVLNERGMVDGAVKVVKPHPNFRIFLTMDERKGEISRAMRNRGIEIYMDEPPVNSIDTLRLLASIGIPSYALASKMIAFQQQVQKQFGTSVENPLTISHILYWGRLLLDQLQRGQGLVNALYSSMDQIYVRPRRLASQRSSIQSVYLNLFQQQNSDNGTSNLLLDDNVNFRHANYFPDIIYHLDSDLSHLFHYQLDQFDINDEKKQSQPQPQQTNGKKGKKQQQPQQTLPQSINSNDLIRDNFLTLPSLLVSRMVYHSEKITLEEIKQSQTIEHSEKLSRYTKVSGEYVIETTSRDNFDLRRQWLLDNKGEDYVMVMKQLFAMPLFINFEEKMNSLLESISLPTYLSQYQGNQWTNNQSLFELVQERSKCVPQLYQRWQEICAAMSLLKTSIAHTLEVCSETRACESILASLTTQSTAISAMSPFAQSYLFASKKITRDAMDFEIVAYIYPFFKSIHDQVQLWISNIGESIFDSQNNTTTVSAASVEPRLQHLISLLTAFRRSLVEPSITFDQGQFTIRWRWIVKELRQLVSLFNVQLAGSLTAVMSRIEQIISSDAETHASNNRLWKMGGHPIASKTEEIAALEDTFYQIQRSIDFNHNQLMVDAPSGHRSSRLDNEWKHTFVEAMSTLYWINEQYYIKDKQRNLLKQQQFDDAKSLIPSIAKMRDVLDAKVKELVAQDDKKKQDTDTDAEKEHFEIAMVRHSREGMWPVYAHYLARLESKIVSELISLFAPDNMDREQGSMITARILPILTHVRPTISEYINHSIELVPTRSPADYVPLQKLLWMIDALVMTHQQEQQEILDQQEKQSKNNKNNITTTTNSVSVSIGIEELQSTIHNIVYSFNSGLWNNSYNDISYVERPSQPSYIYRLKLMPSSSMDTSDEHMDTTDPLKVSYGPPRLLQNIQSTFSFYLATDWKNASVLEIPGKIGQLESLIAHISQVKPIPTFSNEWRTAIISLVTTISQFGKSYDQVIWSTISTQLTILLTYILANDITIRKSNNQQQVEQTFVDNLAGLLKQSSDTYLVDRINRLVLPCLTLVVRVTKTSASLSASDQQLILGQFNLLLGCFRLLMLVPAHAVDPTLKYTIVSQYSREHGDELADQLHVRRSIEKEHSGRDSNITIKSLEQRKQHADHQHQQQQKKITLRPTPSQFPAIHRDLAQFSQQFANIDRIIDLVVRFGKIVQKDEKDESNNNASDKVTGFRERSLDEFTMLLSTERMWQEKASNFTLLLERKYVVAYKDIVVPVLTAVYNMRYGLRVMCDAAVDKRSFDTSTTTNNSNSHVQHLQKVLSSLATYPTTTNASPLETCHLLVGSDTITGIRSMVAQQAVTNKDAAANYKVISLLLRSALCQLFSHIATTSHLTYETVSYIDEIFRVFIDEYKHQEEERVRREAEAASTVKFRTKCHKVETKEEKEEKIFMSSFPSFYKDFADLEDIEHVQEDDDEADQDQAGAAADEGEGYFYQTIKSEEIQQICLLHRMIFHHLDGIALPKHTQGQDQHPLSLDESDRVELFKLFYECASVMMKVLRQRAPLEFDIESSGAHLLAASALRDTLNYRAPSLITYSKLDKNFKFIRQASSLAPTTSSESFVTTHQHRIYNIYRDPNLSEIVIIREPMLSMKGRVNELLVEFPEHPILMLLVKLIERILGYPSSDPLIKIVTGLELLVRKAQEWETFAHKGIKLQEPHLNNIHRIITRWRKIEIESWPTVFQAQEKECESKSLREWFTLYPIINDAPSDSVLESGESMKIRLDEIFKLLQDFMFTSTYGDIMTRLSLLKSFSQQLFASIQLSNPNEQIIESEEKEEDQKEKNLLYYNQRLFFVIQNVYKYFFNFLPQYEKKLTQLIQPIEEKAIEFIRLARWEDNRLLTQYERLKQHIEKSHKTLAKITIKYRNLLSLSCNSIFNEIDTNQLDNVVNVSQAVSTRKTKNIKKKGNKRQVTNQINNNIETIQDWTSVNPKRYILSAEQLASNSACSMTSIVESIKHNDQVLKAFSLDNQELYQNKLDLLNKRMTKIVEEGLLKSGAFAAVRDGVEELDDIANTIIQESQSLANSTDATTKEKQFALHSLMTRFIDLGLTYRVSHYSQEQLQIAFLFGTPCVSEETNKSLQSRFLVDQADAYYYRLIARIHVMRAKSLEYSSDLSAREVQKMSGFVEVLLDMILKQRSELISLAPHCSTLESFISLFKQFSTDDNVEGEEEESTTENGDIQQQQSSMFMPNQEFLIKWLSENQNLFNHLKETMEQIELLVLKSLASSMNGHAKSTIFEAKKSVSQVKESIDKHLSDRRALYHTLGQSLPILGRSTFALLQSNVETLTLAISQLENNPDLECHTALQRCLSIFISSSKSFVEKWNVDITAAKTTIQPLNNMEPIQLFSQQYESIVKHILLSIQNKKSLSDTIQYKEKIDEDKEQEESSEEKKEESEEKEIIYEIQDGHIGKMYTLLSKHTYLLHLEELIPMLIRIHDLLSSDSISPESLIVGKRMMIRLVPLLEQMQLVVDQSVTDLSAMHKTISKLEYIMSGVFTQLFTKGFCKKEDGDGEGEGGDDNGKFEDDVEGTGMGEGEGKKDVSDRIEDKEQLMGLESDKQEEKDEDKEEKDEDEGFDMGEDEFEGDMHDIKEKDQKEDELDKDKEEKEHDKEMGELEQPEDNVVDEKLWGEEDVQDEEEQKEEGKGDDTNSDEMMGKEEDDDKKKKKDKEEEKKEEKKEKNKEKQDTEETQEQEEEDEEEEDEEMGQEDGENVTNEEQEAEQNHMDTRTEDQFELPEEMEFDEEEEEGEAEEGEDGEEEEDPLDKDGEVGESGDDESADEKDQQSDDENDPEKQEDDQEPQQDDLNVPPNAADVESIEPEKPEEEEEEKKQDEEGTSLTSNEQQKEENEQQAEQPLGVKDKSGTKSDVSNMEDEMKEDQSNNANDDKGQTLPTAQDDNKNSSMENMSNDGGEQQIQKKQNKRVDPNPYRSLGDVKKEWKKRLNMFDDQQQQQEQKNKEKAPKQDDSAKENKDQEYKFLNKDDDNQDADQALGAAEDNQIQDLPKEANKPSDGLEEEDQMDLDDDQQEPEQEEVQHEDDAKEDEDKPKISGMSKMNMMEKKMKQEAEKKEMKELDKDQQDPDSLNAKDIEVADKDKESLAMNGSLKENEDEDEDQDEDAEMKEPVDRKKMSREDFEQMRQDLEKWKLDNQGKLDYGSGLWQKYEQLTSDLSQELCEQLRLILEPTLATKLQGDYKSGKRINMKKVIPYIASQFKKDKIWLRRTKPNKRTYQVLVAIDDSESMALYHSGQFALEALTMISRAMSRLEVGQLGIMKFGEDVNLVHPFDQPFSDQCGPQVITQFEFKQPKTDLVTFLAKSTQILEINKLAQSSSSGDAVQLMFIISDGWSLRDPENTKKLLREARNKNIFIVFIVIDNPTNNNSILNFQSVSYVNGKIQTTNYLNEFPFPYYIILRSLDNLPQILGDTLRQWFDLIKQI